MKNQYSYLGRSSYHCHIRRYSTVTLRCSGLFSVISYPSILIIFVCYFSKQYYPKTFRHFFCYHFLLLFINWSCYTFPITGTISCSFYRTRTCDHLFYDFSQHPFLVTNPMFLLLLVTFLPITFVPGVRSVYQTMTALMMTSSNGNIFRVTGLLRGELTGHR